MLEPVVVPEPEPVAAVLVVVPEPVAAVLVAVPELVAVSELAALGHLVIEYFSYLAS